ncbi:alpha/beta fold hydrolase [Amycolatopsis suaedae]|uniref:Alpha/beta fold hydrolase n=1 Tax=Amycolatopsis suaedae TaxID=2510978 RepID=A0A4Q7J6I0_9PSEU|nr:alpha/beta fold hydrolase [Amycolatopsis suaedae]RZQ62372.1 alpha/beta fold hydrolase [Amycolatopsis suaedae]
MRTRTTLAAAALLLTATTVAPADAATGLSWVDCGPERQCAVLTAPVDWDHPDGDNIRVNVERRPARDAAARAGSVLVNLGGPGNSTGILRNPLPPSLAALNERFDIVVFDPRGLGTPDNGTVITCPVRDPDQDLLIRVRDEAGWNQHAERNAAYDAGCRQAAGPAFRGLTAKQVAHDMDAIRAALGEDRLRYFGNSYGTVYGQAYARLFPRRVGRMYLDGVADHTQPRLESWLRSVVVTQERHLSRFRDWCAGRPFCPQGRDRAIDDLLRAAERAPLPAPGAGPGRTVDLAQLRVGVVAGMNPPVWPDFARALTKAQAGDAGDFLTNPRLAGGEVGSGPGTVGRVSNCHDFMPAPIGYRDAMAMEERLRRLVPRAGWLKVRFELGRCAGVAGEPSYPPRPLHTPGLPPVLVGIGELDNNTPNLGAARVARQLPGSRVLWHDDGHAAYFFGNTCLTGHVNRYLTDGTLPPAGTRCPGQLPPN